MSDWQTLVSQALDTSFWGGAVFPPNDPSVPTATPVRGNSQGIESKKQNDVCSPVPTVPPILKRVWDEDIETSASDVPQMPAGGGVSGDSAPKGEAVERACSSCAALRSPGLSDGHCSGHRPDLPGAYGTYHPLRKCPPDGGAGCPTWIPPDG